MDISQFDLNISGHIENLIKLAKDKGLENRCWLIETVFWNDTDYRIDLCSSWGGHRDIFRYQKSVDKYEYHKEVIGGFKMTEVVETEEDLLNNLIKSKGT